MKTRLVLVVAGLVAACTTNNYYECDGGHGSDDARPDAHLDARIDAPPDSLPDSPPDAAIDANTCGDLTCQSYEDATSCPGDCTGTIEVQNQSTYTIYHIYKYDCAGNTDNIDQLGANVLSPGQNFDLTPLPLACYIIVAETQAATITWQSPPYTLTMGGQVIDWVLTD